MPYPRTLLTILLSGATLSLVFCRQAPEPIPAVSPTGRREIPEITFRNLSPPFKDYDYFRGGENHPFQPDAEEFSLTNAWWLAEAATLAYADPAFAAPRFRSAGLPEVRFFSRLSTQCYVASNTQFAVVAFRGSEIWKKRETFSVKEVLADLKTDIDFRLADWPPDGKVHRGFQQALEEVWDDLASHLRQLDQRGCRIWVTGHSLGAALATLCGSRYGNVRGVYTFGSPMIGDENFRRRVPANLYRVVNNDDIVPRLIMPGPYVHVGELVWIDGGGHLVRAPAPQPEHPFPSPGETQGADEADPAQGDPPGSLVPRGFRDHVPLLYAVHLWNNMVEPPPQAQSPPE